MRSRLLVLAPVLLCLACGDDDDPTPVNPNAYQLSYESECAGLCASGWFGGDNRGAPFGPRSVGIGCSVLFDDDIVLESFSMYLEREFDYIENPTGVGHAVTLQLTVRDAMGVAIKSVQTNLANSFDGGWVTWNGIDLDVNADDTVIFTTYLVGAYSTNEYWSAGRGDSDAGYANGVRYTKEGTDDANMEEWSDWLVHPWDAWFRVTGERR